MQRTSSPGRIEALDYLRGFFILVIIVDHLWRWPNAFQFVSGRGELWVSAAEGFVIISGLLVGYIRGRKNLKKPFFEVGQKLVLRGLMLYAWAFITTVLLVALSWYLSFKSSIAFIPYAKYDWGHVIHDALTLNYAHSLTHFLYLYAIFLIFAPLLVLLLRWRLWWAGLIVSLGLWWFGFTAGKEWMQWQILFYLPAIAGFYLDQIIAFCRKIPSPLIWIFVGIGGISMIASALIILPTTPGTYHIELFGREPLTLARIGLAFYWFIALAYLFDKFQPFIHKMLGWLLLPFGTRSLTAYIMHSFVLTAIAFFIPLTSPLWLNTLLAIIAILTTWALIKIPNINKVIPR